MRGIHLAPRDAVMVIAFALVFVPLAIVAHVADVLAARVRGRR